MSSNDIAISIRALSKSYTITSNVERHITMAEALLDRAKNPFRRLETETFWALTEVAFDVAQGEVVGIIGRNGAGKSTLLKVLSQITEPTAGEVRLYGRVGSLLEVGTGFHPELTGRENIYMNGAILGMSRREIHRQFDQIVDFAEVVTFLDTPVKRYSSGMYVRLAFAIAAHLNPEILIVDEVLAVGDAAFQAKCLGKMEDVAKSGRTVLFVSHNMDAVRRLCTRGIVIEGGRAIYDGPTQEALRSYFDMTRRPTTITSVGLKNRLNRTSGAVRFTQVTAQDALGQPTWDFRSGDSIRFALTFEAHEDVRNLGIYVSISSLRSKEIITTISEPLTDSPVQAGETHSCIVELPHNTLRPGDYSLYFLLGSANLQTEYDVVDENINIPILSVTSEETDPYKTRGYCSMATDITFN